MAHAGGQEGGGVAAEGLAVLEQLHMVGAAQACEYLDELGLAVALDAGDAQNLPLAQGEAHVAQDGHAPLGEGEAAHGKVFLPHLLGPAGDGELHVAPHHHLGQLVHGGSRHGDAALDHFALAQHRHPVGDLHGLLKLVGDDNDALARGLELPHDPEEILHLLGGEHRGGLV